MTASLNPFDQACRYLAKLDPAGFIGWALALVGQQFRFVRWLDTRQIPFPGEADRTCDTVAHLENLSTGGEPWALPIEFCVEPDARMFGRLLVYAGSVWLEVRPADNRGDRFFIGGVVVNLTGKGNTSRSMRWDDAGMSTIFQVAERNLASQSASQTLSNISKGITSIAVLPFIPLMQAGGESVIVEEWLRLASSEPDVQRRGDLGGLALVFAEASKRSAIWKQALKGWNVMQSKQVLEWQSEARAEGLLEGQAKGLLEGQAKGLLEGQAKGRLEQQKDSIIEVLSVRFGSVPDRLIDAVRSETDSARLGGLLVMAARSASLDDFRRDSSLS